MIGIVAGSIALVIVAFVAHNFGVRWLAATQHDARHVEALNKLRAEVHELTERVKRAEGSVGKLAAARVRN